MIRKLFSLLAILFVLVSCGESRMAVSTADFPITNGSPPSLGHAAVVALLQSQGQRMRFFCSGTLIRPNVVLTAGHCLQDGRGNPKKLWVFTGDNLFVGGTLYAVSKTATHPDYSPSPVMGYVNDIALVRLKSSVLGITPIPTLPKDKLLTSADAGAVVSFVGFGQDSEGPSGSGSIGRKLQVSGTIGGVSNPCTYSDGTIASCLNSELSQVWYKEGLGQGGPCFGDSGGPMLIVRDGASYASGVTSYGDATCSRYGVSTRPDAYECWINEFSSPGSCPSDPGGGDPPPLCDLLPAGDPCFSNSDCCSGKCRGKPGLKTCR